jgi:hypothetical protein
LPESYLVKARELIQRRVFNAKARRKAWWVAWWSLFFASDHYYVHYYQSKWFPVSQMELVGRYQHLRTWWDGSTQQEVWVDVLIVVLATMVHVVLVHCCLQATACVHELGFDKVTAGDVAAKVAMPPSPGVVVMNVLAFPFIWAFTYDFLYQKYLIGRFYANERPTVRQRIKALMSMAFWGTFGTVTMVLMWHHQWAELVVWRGFVFVYYRVKRRTGWLL